MSAGKAKLVIAAAVALAMASGAHHHHHHGGLAGVLDAMPQVPLNGAPDVRGNAALGQRMAARGYGWTGQNWNCLYELWQRESGWDAHATYPSHDTPPSVPGSSITTAYGIPQALPAQKMAAAGADWQTNPATQIRWGLGYIARTYGNPCSALNFEIAHAGY